MEKCFWGLNKNLRFSKGCILDEALFGQDRFHSILIRASNIGPSFFAQHLVTLKETAAKSKQ